METQIKTAHVLADREAPENSFCEILSLSREEKKELLKLWKERNQ